MNTRVTLEIAKLLKEMGFDKVMKYHYPDLDVNKQKVCICIDWNKFTDMSGDSEYYSAPTIAEVVMWIYEKYDIWVGVSINRDHIRDRVRFKNNLQTNEYFTPTEAYIEAIIYTLKNLI